MDNDRTNVALREYLERIVAHESALTAERFASMEKALAKASEAMNIRLEAMNEFRHQIEAQERRYAERIQVESLEEKFNFRLTKLEQSAVITGKAAIIWVVIIIGLAVVSAAISLMK